MSKTMRTLLNAVVALVGLYMVVAFGKGAINPPMISGIAFILLGVSGMLK